MNADDKTQKKAKEKRGEKRKQSERERESLLVKQSVAKSGCLHAACESVHIYTCALFLPMGLQCPCAPGGLCIFNQ